MTTQSPLLVAARTLATDGVTAEVVSAWADVGVPAVLLKGPTLADWLYDATRPRPYGDSDLLVPPDKVEPARGVLRGLGFAAHPVDALHSAPWVRAHDGAEVDLHHALWGARRRHVDQWRILTGRFTETAVVGGARVMVPTRPASALLVALHAAQHKDRPGTTPHEDLRRALAVATLEDWRGAEHVADRLDALDAFAEGLSLQPEGEGVVAHLRVVAASRLPQRERGPALLAARVASATGLRAQFEGMWQSAGLGRGDLANLYPHSPVGIALLRRITHLVLNVGRLRRLRRQ